VPRSLGLEAPEEKCRLRAALSGFIVGRRETGNTHLSQGLEGAEQKSMVITYHRSLERRRLDLSTRRIVLDESKCVSPGAQAYRLIERSAIRLGHFFPVSP
jgi:hypothetical protein